MNPKLLRELIDKLDAIEADQRMNENKIKDIRLTLLRELNGR